MKTSEDLIIEAIAGCFPESGYRHVEDNISIIVEDESEDSIYSVYGIIWEEEIEGTTGEYRKLRYAFIDQIDTEKWYCDGQAHASISTPENLLKLTNTPIQINF